MSLKKQLGALTITGVVLLGGTLVSAGTTWSGTEYQSIPGNNGMTTSSTQNKAKTNASSDLSVTSVSKTNAVDVRAVGGAGQGTGAWVRNVNKGSFSIPNPVAAKKATELQFSSDLLAPTISYTTKWRSN